MKNIYLKTICTFIFSVLSISVYAQFWRTGGNAPCPNPQCVDGTNNIFGTSGNFPIRIHTNGTQRMHINESTANTSGFVGINTTNPLFPLHVRGDGTATGQGWRRGIMLSNQGALMWNGAPHTNRNFFMAHSSSSPAGNFNAGYSTGIGAGAPVNYVSSVFVTTNPSGGPDGSKEIRKWFVS